MTSTGLDPERWRLIESILDRLFDAPEAERPALLDEACGDDGELRAQVEALLDAEQESGPLGDGARHTTWIAQTMAAATGSSLEGTHLGPYRVDRVLGAGGMGVVYEGWDTRLERSVAIKLLPPGLTFADSEQRFLREARTASALDHPNICAIYDLGTASDGRLYLVMALYRGETLKSRLDGGPLDVAEARDLACQVASGLQRAHEAGIVHRDIKPANVLITEHGEAKILDFGLAKALTPDAAASAGSGASPTSLAMSLVDEAGLTGTGALLGTPGYMAPEQITGAAIDARTDIWAFGVMLYEMLAGRRPFATGTGYSAVASVLHTEPEPLSGLRDHLPAEIETVVARALMKDPARRPESMEEILRELREPSHPASPERATTTVFSVPSAAPGRPRAVKLAAAVLALAGLVTWGLVRNAGDGATTDRAGDQVSSAAPVDPAEAARLTGLLVLSFRNLTPDPEIDALGPVITEMLVTDLRGSPELRVASTSRLHRAMTALGLSGRQAPTQEVIRSLADETGRENVLHGSFTRLGEKFRILATLERPADDTVLISKQLEATESGLFTAIDELSSAVRKVLQASTVAGSPSSVREVTTDSLQAMRHYSEGLLFFYDQETPRAISALEQAVEIDPEFALAWRRLGLILDNLGQRERAKTCLQRAFELADRLPPKQRIMVRADHYGSFWSTLGRSIEIHEQGLELYPNETSWRNNLGFSYAQIEKYEQALGQYQKSIALGTSFGYAYVNIALILRALGRGDQGFEVLSEYAERHPGEWAWQNALAWHLVVAGDLDQALDRLNRARGLVASTQPRIERNAWRLHALREDWPRAREAAAALSNLDGAKNLREGELAHARLSLLQGRSEQALGHLQTALRQGNWPSLTRTLEAELLLERGEPESALDAALEAQRGDPGGWFELRGLFLAALAEQARGRRAEADQRAETLRNLVSGRDNPVERRLLHHLAGRLALERGEIREAREELRDAAALLPARGDAIESVEPPHVAIWLAAGRAAAAEGDLDQALAWLQKAAGAGSERLVQPVAWSRSLYELGEIHRRRGDLEEAARYFERFLAYRRHGDLDRDLLTRAAG